MALAVAASASFESARAGDGGAFEVSDATRWTLKALLYGNHTGATEAPRIGATADPRASESASGTHLEQIVAKISVLQISALALLTASMSVLSSTLSAKEVKIQVKSFIRHMAGPGEPNSQPPSEATKKALGFEGLTQTRTDAYLFLLATDKMFSEEPPNGDKASAQFRLWSQVVADVTCDANKVVATTFKPLDTSFGKEGPLNSVGDVSRALTSKMEGNVATFSYRVRGRPHNSSIVAFTAVRPRSCSYIWHDVSGVVTCTGGAPAVKVTLTASAFPTHKVWVNGKLQAEQPQGPFENLWKCDPADSTEVQ